MRQAFCCVLAVIQGDKFQSGDRLDGNHAIFSSVFGFTGLPVRLGGRYPDPAPQAEGKCRLNPLESSIFLTLGGHDMRVHCYLDHDGAGEMAFEGSTICSRRNWPMPASFCSSRAAAAMS